MKMMDVVFFPADALCDKTVQRNRRVQLNSISHSHPRESNLSFRLEVDIFSSYLD